MKKIPLILIVSLSLPATALSQVFVIDPILQGVATTNAIEQNRRLDEIRKRQTTIQRYQSLAVGHLKMINDWQNKLYNGLSQVSQAVKDIYSLKEVYSISKDIIDYQIRIADHAKGNPLLLIFAKESTKEFKRKAYELVLYIESVALTGGPGLIMDAGERAAIIQKILRELQVIRGIAYGAERQMFWAKRDGFFKSIVPFSTWDNKEKAMASTLLATYKF